MPVMTPRIEVWYGRLYERLGDGFQHVKRRQKDDKRKFVKRQIIKTRDFQRVKRRQRDDKRKFAKRRSDKRKFVRRRGDKRKFVKRQVIKCTDLPNGVETR